MLPPLPRCSSWVSSSLISPRRISLPRFHCRVGLHIDLFEVCSAFTHVAACTLAQSPYFVTAIRRLQTFRLLYACSGCFRRERIAGWGLHPLKSAALSRRTWEPVIRTGFLRELSHCSSKAGAAVRNSSLGVPKPGMRLFLFRPATTPRRLATSGLRLRASAFRKTP